MTPGQAKNSPRSKQPIDDEYMAVVSEGLGRLIAVTSRQGRDWKLVAALIQTITDFIREVHAQVYTEDAVTPVLLDHKNHPPQPDADTNKVAERRLSPVFTSRVKAVVDSWSDDETAWFLNVGLRQVQRRAQAGDLHYFMVGRKRRYPTWQFDWRYRLLPGVREVTRAIPNDWSPERTHAFMTTFESGLNVHGEQLTPAEWLMVGSDASQIIELMRRREQEPKG